MSDHQAQDKDAENVKKTFPVQRHLKRLDPAVLSGSWLGILIACTGFALDYFLNLALSQWLNPEDLGDYSVASSAAVFGGMIAMLGADQALMQYLPQYLKEKDWPRIKGILKFSFLLVLGSSVAIGMLGFSFAFIKSDHPILITFVALPVISLVLLSTKALRCFHHIFMATAPTNIGLPILVMSGGYYLVEHGGVDDWDLVGVFTLSFMFILLFQLILLKHHMKGEIRQAIPIVESREWTGTALTLMLSAVLFIAMEQMGLYMCELLSGEEDVAIYAVLVKHARFLLIIFVAVNFSVLPYITPALQQRNHNKVQRLYGTSMHVVLWGGLIPLILFIVKGKELLRAFGVEYEIGYHSLMMLMAAYYLNFVAGFSVPFLQFAGHRRIVISSIAIALFIEIILFSWLVPAYGFVGATWSMVVTLSGLSLWLMFQCWYRLNLTPLKLSSRGEG
ncbi:MAG: hypothetical protein HWE30_05660 [Methylocystaceae bacterium]|nr:hypothetical protein [Methylocystaceae bacterium]